MSYTSYCLIAILFQFSTHVFGQSNSYQYKMEVDNIFGTVTILANENKEVSLVLRKKYLHNPQSVVQLTNGVCSGYSFAYPSASSSNSGYFVSDVAYKGIWAYIIGKTTELSHLVALNMSTGDYWCKKFFTVPIKLDFPNFSLASNGDMLVLNGVSGGFVSSNFFYPNFGIFELFRLDSNGNTIWKKGLLLKDSLQVNNLFVTAQGITVSNADDIYISGYIVNDSPEHHSSHVLLKLDSQGNPIIWKKINHMAFDISLFTDDAIYLLDKRQTDVGFHPDNKESAIIAKLDYDFNLLWLKKYSGENFPYYTADITASPSGGLYLSSVTTGVYPVILAELSADGDILGQKGYAHYTPRPLILSDGSLVIASAFGFDSLGNIDPRPVVAKTDPAGNIAGCTTLQTCLTVSDTTVTFGSFHVEPHPVLDLEDLPLLIEPVSYTLTPFCDFPPPPLPTFSFPDTLCTGQSATTQSDNNRLAQTREWELIGPGLDSLLHNAFEFTYTFNEPGEYLLRQSVWVLGCRKDFERSITVLPPLSVAIEADSLLCPNVPHQISAAANRPAGYLWSNQHTGAILPLNASGKYAVTVTDGVCEATDSVSVTFVADFIGSGSPFQLPMDTTVCALDLPFLLVPQSMLTDVFYFENGTLQASSYLVPSAGTYKVGMNAFGCEFEQYFHLKVDCRSKVYLPNSFSPNGDGINDTFQPFGNDFEVLELTIYDRWGGQRFHSTDALAAWNGDNADQGVYVWRLVYKDLLNLETVILSGEVVVVK